MSPRAVTRLAVVQYKSIERCDVELGPLTLLVGRNGVGKSNILDALRFVTDALSQTLDHAVRLRGGIDQVRRKSLGGRPTRPGIRVDLALADGGTARYGFLIADVRGRSFRVEQETCEVTTADGTASASFEISKGQLVSWTAGTSVAPAVVEDRLLLVAASGVPEFRPVFDHLRTMAFHNLNPQVMKDPQRPESGSLLSHDGRNLSSVVKQLEAEDPGGLERVRDYLAAIGVPIARIKHKPAGALETIEVSQVVDVPGGQRNSNFDAISLSDGTVRAMGILVSLISARRAGGPSLVGIEEPETALHPAAAGALMDALTEGATRTQLIVTCHSPDLLDNGEVTPQMIRPVLLSNGKTVVGCLDRAKEDLLKRHLSTAGELLRLDQLEPDAGDVSRQAEGKGTLWEAIA